MLIALYAAAALVGYVVGTQLVGGSTSTPLARVGFVLREQNAQGGPTAWQALRRDVEAFRQASKPEERGVVDLVVALRGLDSDGVTDWGKAEQLCRALKWPRCDRASLEEMKRRSRP